MSLLSHICLSKPCFVLVADPELCGLALGTVEWTLLLDTSALLNNCVLTLLFHIPNDASVSSQHLQDLKKKRRPSYWIYWTKISSSFTRIIFFHTQQHWKEKLFLIVFMIFATCRRLRWLKWLHSGDKGQMLWLWLSECCTAGDWDPVMMRGLAFSQKTNLLKSTQWPMKEWREDGCGTNSLWWKSTQEQNHFMLERYVHYICILYMYIFFNDFYYRDVFNFNCSIFIFL